MDLFIIEKLQSCMILSTEPGSHEQERCLSCVEKRSFLSVVVSKQVCSKIAFIAGINDHLIDFFLLIAVISHFTASKLLCHIASECFIIQRGMQMSETVVIFFTHIKRLYSIRLQSLACRHQVIPALDALRIDVIFTQNVFIIEQHDLICRKWHAVNPVHPVRTVVCQAFAQRVEAFPPLRILLIVWIHLYDQIGLHILCSSGTAVFYKNIRHGGWIGHQHGF